MTKSGNTSYKLNNWELIIVFIGFIAIVCLIISIYAAQIKEKFYPWGPVAYGGPWNIPTRYPIRGWGWDIRGYPAPYPIDYPYGPYGYPGGQPAYPAPNPNGSNNTNTAKSNNSAPFAIEMTRRSLEMTPTKPTTTTQTNTKPSTATNTKPSTANNTQSAQNEDRAAAEYYEKESRWWPDWVSWPWRPYYNYGLHYDVNGKLKPSDNDSIVANHSWAWW